MFIVSLITATAGLIAAAYFASLLDQWQGWFWLVFMAGGLFVVSSLGAGHRVQWISPLVIGAGLILTIQLLDPTLAVYIGGVWLLVAVVVMQGLSESKLPYQGRVLAIVMTLTALALIVIPIPVSRLVLHLPNVAVPTHFALFSDPDNTPPVDSMFYQDRHKLSPLEVKLDTDSDLPPGAEMPWLRFAVTRDSNVIVEHIRYQSQIGYFFVDVHSRRHQQLHQLELSPLSHEVRLNKPETGIVVDQIAFGEEAWIKIPNLTCRDIQTGDRLKVIAIRLAFWAFLCLTFLLWQPRPARNIPEP